MKDRLVGRLGLAIRLRVSNGGEPSLAAQVTEIVGEFIDVELSAVIEDDGTGNAEASDDVSPNKPSYFSGGYRGYGLDLYPLGEVVHSHKEVLALPHSPGERAEDVCSPSNEW